MNDGPANLATGVTAIGAATSLSTYLAQANTVVSILAGLVAIVAGIYAILHYRKSLKKP
jgi:uncharacterized membrane protein HdeD (DUF308 family)